MEHMEHHIKLGVDWLCFRMTRARIYRFDIMKTIVSTDSQNDTFQAHRFPVWWIGSFARRVWWFHVG